MSDGIALTPTEADALVRALEGASLVHRRHQFFMWTQGQFQTLLPHSVLACGTYHRQRRNLVFDPFNSVVLSSAAQSSLTDAEAALIRSAVAIWIAGGGRALAITAGDVSGRAQLELARLHEELHCQHLVLHGVARPQRPSEIESLFVFAASREDAVQRQVQCLEMLLPHLHSIWRHVQSIERSLQVTRAAATHGVSPPPQVERHLVTDRERQILLWMREGMSNPQIGEVLSISPLTVKNHVQKILRKLNAANRAQAVAQAMSLNLLLLDDHRHADSH